MLRDSICRGCAVAGLVSWLDPPHGGGHSGLVAAALARLHDLAECRQFRDPRAHAQRGTLDPLGNLIGGSGAGRKLVQDIRAQAGGGIRNMTGGCRRRAVTFEAGAVRIAGDRCWGCPAPETD